jgi:hypothetical protein
MDEPTIAAEEEWQVQEAFQIAATAQQKANQLEQEWMELRNQELDQIE